MKLLYCRELTVPVCFKRGQTQVMSVATLGPLSEAQTIDGINEQTEKRYMHHYNFPPYSVGEARP